uniref:F-ATPase protein 6 n=1 Tax=Protostrongylus rufescens TaxID=321386 RepID=A0A059SE94_PRORF|nr:ATP synthase F0 subunit 6 [Protostrongylus rufescens]AGW80390.1 ATP synthase F0 subunit 6 [Protostrongylus rufescens]
MNQVYFLDVLVFLFFLNYLVFVNSGLLKEFYNKFFLFLTGVYSYVFFLPMSYLISFFAFLLLLVFCFGGYFSYSFNICGMLEFTLIFSLVAWFSTVLVMMSEGKISVYFSKSGDSYLKTFTMLLIEMVSELSRPVALTIRLTVNVMVGHLIVGFLYSMLELNLGEGYVWLTVLAIMMECFVFFIQSYIFSRLIYLYLNE